MKGFIEIVFDDRKRLIAIQSIVAVSENKGPGYSRVSNTATVKTSITLNHPIPERGASVGSSQIYVSETYQDVLALIEAAL
jgi:hypothetical protein